MAKKSERTITLQVDAQTAKELLRDLAFANAGYSMTAILGYVDHSTEVGELYEKTLAEVRKIDPAFNPLS